MTLFHRLVTYLWLASVATFLCCPSASAQQGTPTASPNPEALRQEVKKLKHQVEILDERIGVLSSRIKSQSDSPANPNANIGTGGLAILFGAFCALWAQHTKRNAFLWFFLGAIFNVIAVLVLLYKNSKDKGRGHLTAS